MCGRFGRRADKQRIAEWMQTHNTDVFDDSYLAPSYNVAPQSFQPVVRLSPDTGERELTIMRWGLIPFWSKDGKIAFNTINAKAEIHIVLVLTHADRFGVNLYQLGQRVLQPAGNRDGATHGQIKIGKLLSGDVRGRVDTGA
jgi:hypothetical protein